MRPPHLLPYRPIRAATIIVKGRACTHSHRGQRFELTWVRSVDDDGDVSDVFRQRRCDVSGRWHDGELPIDHGVAPAVMFDRYVELYRAIAEEADGVPAPGQLQLPGVER